jgi:hypothetical protein
LCAPLLRPGLEAVQGQELTGVEVDRRPEGPRIPGAACGGRSILEGLDIHPQRTIGAQDEPLVAEVEVAGSAPAGAMGSRVRRATWSA